jgi:hypothetical protein
MKTMYAILILIFTLLTPASLNAVPNDVITLSGVSAEEKIVTIGEAANLTLFLNDPLNNGWSPVSGLTGTFLKTQIMYCPEANWTGANCLDGGSVSLTSISEIVSRLDNQITFSAQGSLPKGKFILWRIYLYEVSHPSSDPHDYRRNQSYVFESGLQRTDIPVPDFASGDIEVVDAIAALPIEEDQIEENEKSEVEEEIFIPNTPTPPAAIQRPAARSVQAAPVVAPAIQSNFFLPAIKGDQYWRPLREVKGNFENWRVGKRNSLDGVSNRFTKINGSLMTFTTTGDAVSVRYLAGKKRGGFSIYVNGQFLDRVDANQKRKKTLVKTWDGLGDGKHYIDIVAELSNDQSLAINGVQKLKK